MKLLTLIVEDKVTQEIVQRIFRAANYPIEQVEFVVADSKRRAAILADISVMLGKTKHTALLLDSDKQTLPDAAKDNPDFSMKGLKTFFAIPEIEAWLFADISLLENNIASTISSDTLQRIPLPEEIPYPKQLASNFFGKKYVSRREDGYPSKIKYKQFENLDFLLDLDIEKASGRSYSLNHFLNGIADLLEIKHITSKDSMAVSIDRRIFANLLREVMPSDAIVYKSLDGRQITAESMLTYIEEGSSIAQQYTSELLRIARDFIKRQANK